MKKILSVILALAALCSLSAFGTVSAGAGEEKSYDKYIKDIEETVIEIDGLSRAYKFLQVTDSHMVDISSNTSSYYYAESLERYKQFAGQPIASGAWDPTSNGYPAKDTLSAMFDYANDPDNSIDCMWLTGDIIDFPSSENVSFMNRLIGNMKTDRMYCFGNHDWTYPAKYFTNEGRNNFRPLLTNAMGGNNLVSFRDYGEFVVVMIDNSENYIYYSGVADFIRNTVVPLNKPTILLCHVPFFTNDLLSYSKSVWGTDETMANPNGSTKYPYNASTKYIYEWATTNPNVKAIFTGHFHINYEGKTGNTPIYTTAAGYQGAMRVITVRPKYCPVHTWDEGEVITAPTARPGELHHTCTVCGYSENAPIPALATFGDVNCDGEIDFKDALMIRKYLAHVVALDTDAEFYAADVNEDGVISAKDSLMLRRYLADLISELGA